MLDIKLLNHSPIALSTEEKESCASELHAALKNTADYALTDLKRKQCFKIPKPIITQFLEIIKVAKNISDHYFYKLVW